MRPLTFRDAAVSCLLLVATSACDARLLSTTTTVDAGPAVLAPKDPESVAVIATGGLATLVIDHCETVTRYEPELTLIGLRLIFERNPQ